MSAELARAAAGLATAYLLGTVPFGVVLSRAASGPDPRAVGSGNIGATNVLRAVGARLAALTLLLDVAKGFAALSAARAVGPAPEPEELLSPGSLYLTAALVLPVVGHCFPPWLRFRGGKGVATGLGVVLSAWWPAALAGAAVFAVAVGATRVVSLGSLLAAATVPLVLALRPETRGLYLPGGLAIGTLIFLRHRANIRRMARGTESRLGQTGRPQRGSF